MHQNILLWLCSFAWLLTWRHNGHDGVSNHQPHDCLLNSFSGADQRKHQSSPSVAFVRGIHRGPANSIAQMASNVENVSIWWRHHGIDHLYTFADLIHFICQICQFHITSSTVFITAKRKFMDSQKGMLGDFIVFRWSLILITIQWCKPPDPFLNCRITTQPTEYFEIGKRKL